MFATGRVVLLGLVLGLGPWCSTPARAAPGEQQVTYTRPPLSGLLHLVEDSLDGSLAWRSRVYPWTEDRFGRSHDRTGSELELRLQARPSLLDGLSLVLDGGARLDDEGYHAPLLGEGRLREQLAPTASGQTTGALAVNRSPLRSTPQLQALRGEQPLRPVLSFDDLYLLLARPRFDLRLGIQTLAWGTGNVRNPTDNLNPWDYSDPFAARKLGVLAACLDLYVADFDLQLVALPFFVPHRLPATGQRFATPPPPLAASPLPVQLRERQAWPAFPAEAQLGGRLSRSLGGWDLSLSGYRGYDKTPVVRLTADEQAVPGAAAPLLTVTQGLGYQRLTVLGADFATTLAGLAPEQGWLSEVLPRVQLHGEGAWVDSGSVAGDDTLQYVVGLEYTFPDLVADQDLRLLLDWTDELVLRERRERGTEQTLAGLSPPLQAAFEPLLPAVEDWLVRATLQQRRLRGSLASRLTWELSDELALELLWVQPLRERASLYLRPELRWQVSDRLRLLLGYDHFRGEAGTLFGDSLHEDRAFGQATLSF